MYDMEVVKWKYFVRMINGWLSRDEAQRNVCEMATTCCK
jgi:hypothetical protein